MKRVEVLKLVIDAHLLSKVSSRYDSGLLLLPLLPLEAKQTFEGDWKETLDRVHVWKEGAATFGRISIRRVSSKWCFCSKYGFWPTKNLVRAMTRTWSYKKLRWTLLLQTIYGKISGQKFWYSKLSIILCWFFDRIGSRSNLITASKQHRANCAGRRGSFETLGMGLNLGKATNNVHLARSCPKGEHNSPGTKIPIKVGS